LKAFNGKRGVYERVRSFQLYNFPYNSRDLAHRGSGSAVNLRKPLLPEAYIDVLIDDTRITGYVIDLIWKRYPSCDDQVE
jgi:hypothetical protein